MSNKIHPVAIVGGGFAGITAARALKDAGIPFNLYEASDQLAGLARSFKDKEGFSYDFGTHLITNRLATELGVLDECREVAYFGETVFMDGKSYAYPFGLMKVPRYLLSALKSRLNFMSSTPQKNAAEWFRVSLGTALADDVAIPLLEAVMGAPATKLTASVGDKLPGVLRTIYLRLAGKLTGRAVAIGYTRDLPENPRVWHTYPTGGIGMICTRLAQGLEDNFHLNCRAEKIIVSNERVEGVQINGEFIPASIVISTAPLNILPRLIDGSDSLKHLEQFRYSPAIFVNLRLKGRGLLPDVVLWTPESKFPFFRLQEATISMPWLAPEGKTVITADINCKVDDEYWIMEDEELGQLCLERLKSIIPDISERYLGCNVLRTRIAYPTLLASLDPIRQQLKHGTGIDGLYSVGRNGEFEHIMMEDGYHRVINKVKEIVTKLQN